MRARGGARERDTSSPLAKLPARSSKHRAFAFDRQGSRASRGAPPVARAHSHTLTTGGGLPHTYAYLGAAHPVAAETDGSQPEARLARGSAPRRAVPPLCALPSGRIRAQPALRRAEARARI